MALSDQHRNSIAARGFNDEQIQYLEDNGIVESLTAAQIQSKWLDAFPKMTGNEGGALLLRFNDATTSLKPDAPEWNDEKQRFDKYLYAKRPDNQPKGFNTQPWIPSKKPRIATEGLFDALVATSLMATPCAAATAPSHIRYAQFPDSVKVYISDADVPYHHFTGLLPVVIGQAREKGLKLAHLPRNPDADYAYEDNVIPDDCKWGMEEWCKAWTEQGLDPQQQLQKIIASAKEPFDYLRSIFLDYAKAGIRYPINDAQLVTGARAIADATDRQDQRQALRDLLHEVTKAPKRWIEEQIRRRCAAIYEANCADREERNEQGFEELPEPIEPTPRDPYEIGGGRPIDVHISNLLLDADALYGSSQSSLYTYDFKTGFWSRIPQAEALRMVQTEVERVFTVDKYGVQSFPYGTSAQVASCLTALITKAHEPKLADPEPCIPFTDQTYNCRTEQAEPHSPEHGATYGVNAPLLLTADCPEDFRSAIATCYGEEVLPVIRAWIRALIDPTIPYGKFLLIVGNSGTGKGMLLEFFDSLLPSTCRSSLEEPGDINNADKVYQFVLGKRYIAFHDLPPKLKPMQLFYKLVENAEVTARKLNASDSTPISPNCRFSAGTTKLPTLADGNDGFVRRAILLTTKPRLAQADRSIKASLVGNTAKHQQLRSEVMGWALSMPRQDVVDILYGDAAADILGSNLDELEANADAVAHFIDECLEPANCEVTPTNWDWLYDCFRAYCDKKGFNGKGSQFHLQGRIRGKLPHLHRKRGKESTAVAKANGRDRNTRLNLPSCDWGYKLREGAFQRRIDRDPRVDSGCFGSEGLDALRHHTPDCPQDRIPDSESTAQNTVRPKGDAPSKLPVIAVGDAVSQGSSSIDEQENKKRGNKALNTLSHIHLSIEEPAVSLNPEHPETPQVPDWMLGDLPF